MKINIDFDNDGDISALKKKIKAILPDEPDIEELHFVNKSVHSFHQRTEEYKRMYTSARLYARIAERRRKLIEGYRKQEARRLEKLIKKISSTVVLFPGDHDDDGSLRDYLISHYLSCYQLIDIDDEYIAAAFSSPAFYFDLYNNRTAPAKDREFWLGLIEKHSGMSVQPEAGQGERDSAAGESSAQQPPP